MRRVPASLLRDAVFGRLRANAEAEFARGRKNVPPASDPPPRTIAMLVSSIASLTDSALEQALSRAVIQEAGSTAALLAHIAEFDVRELHVPAGFPRMINYCVRRLRLSEDAAATRVTVARAARLYPQLLAAISENRLHLTGARFLIPHLTPENADELIKLASYKSKHEIDDLLASRQPGPSLALEPVGGPQDVGADALALSGTKHASNAHVPEPVILTSHATTTPRYPVHFTVDQAGRELIQEAVALARHAVPSGRTEDVLMLALAEYVARRKKQKFGLTTRRGRRRASGHARHIPAEVRQAVWERDQGRCTFPGCDCRDHLHYDHIPVALGGLSTTENLRLRCWKHNQYEAEQRFGRAFMHGKRERAQRERAQARIARERETQGHAPALQSTPAVAATLEAEPAACLPAAPDPAAQARAEELASKKRDVASALRNLGVKKDEIARAVALCDGMADAPLEVMLKEVLKTSFYPRGIRGLMPATKA